MKLRAPAYPLINVDPYFSLWSMADRLNDDTVKHWTGKPNTMIGTVTVDGMEEVFMGGKETQKMKRIPQISVDFNALTTTYIFADEKIRLNVRFTTPLLPDDLKRMTRPVGYLAVSYGSVDGREHEVKLTILASEELVMNVKGDDGVTCESVSAEEIPCEKIGRENPKMLERSGDDLRIEWGYFYLGMPKGEMSAFRCEEDKMTYVMGKRLMVEGEQALILFAYDDIYSLDYFGTHLKSVWNQDGTTILQAIAEAAGEYETLFARCEAFSEKLYGDAVKAGGKKYAEVLSLAFRQVISAHKCAVDPDGKIVFISKECFSNGCAATVDVSYPSIPMFLLYNPELVKGMMRPIYHYARGGVWKFDFAPHDAGQYPLVHGQVYGDGSKNQMPVEECGNMLIMEAAVAAAENDASFAAEHMDILHTWVQYLVKYGDDPENQLCTDDFAGHLAHNCNLSVKAVMGIAGYALLNRMLGNGDTSDIYFAKAKEMAKSWCERARNEDGSYRLAFDRPGTFSMKYNAVWDQVFGTDLFPREALESELASNFRHMNPYGMPLDCRADYTKSDWLVWTATLLSSQEDFERYFTPLWNCYHYTKSRVPLTDWYDTITAQQVGFQNRTVQGGLFMKLLDTSGKMRIKQ